jgi:hypothetical protein
MSAFFFVTEIFIRIPFLNDLHKHVIILHTYMPFYTMIYTTYSILLSSDKLRKGPAKSTI